MVVFERERDSDLSRALVSRMLNARGLHLKASKTRIVNLESRKRNHASKFDFLGYKIHLRAYPDNPKRYWIARQPSESARASLRAKIKESLPPSESEAPKRLFQLWGGSEYFRHGNSSRILRRERKGLRHGVLYYLRKKYRSQRRPLSCARLYQKAGVICAGLSLPQTESAVFG